MAIVYRVQHAEGRDEPLHRLLAQMPAETTIINDHEIDDPNPWRNYKRCLSDLPSDATHVLVIQDDAVVCRNFREAVARVVAARPDTVISLFVGGLRNRTQREFLRALKADYRWVPIHFRDIHHVVALVWPISLAVEFLAWAETARLPGHRITPRSDDAIIGTWARLTHHQVWACVPSLVEHPDDVPSTVGLRAAAGQDRGRVALAWIGEGDPLSLDWAVTS